MSVYALIGAAFLMCVFVFFAMMLIAVCFVRLKLFPRFSLVLLNFFNRPLKMVLGYFHLNPAIVDRAGVMLINSICYEAYCRTPFERRLLLLPQCLRDLSCAARVSPLKGISCECCGACVIGEMKMLCDEHGINMRVAPGGEFAKRAIRELRPQAVIGVACESDLFKVMRFAISKGIPSVGVLLLRGGCVSTDVDAKTLKSVLLARASEGQKWNGELLLRSCGDA